MGKKRVNRNLRNSWNLDRHLSSETLSQNMDESERVDALRITHDYEGGFVDPFLATPSKSPPGKKKRDSNDVSLAEIFNAIHSINSKQDLVIQKITHIESFTEVTTAAVNSLSDTVNRLLSDVASHGEKIVLAKLVEDKPSTLDQYLDAAMFGVDGSFENAYSEEGVVMDIKCHEQIMELVEKNVEKTQDRTRRRLSKRQLQSLQVGDMVWRKNVRSEQRKEGKLDPDYFGPFMVTKIEDIHDAWEGKNAHVLLSRIGSYKLFYWDIEVLHEKTKLPDVQADSQHKDTQRPKRCHLM
ncbi:myosin-1 isoform X3 [Labeo rohita]|uniref:Myosin-1 isoform X3 n=1 Tax=Labeo rohita TaxID=84645 RepID=A0A498M357_LABRO|nr:myosin-1 isoform X3 [Labeo rohita]